MGAVGEGSLPSEAWMSRAVVRVTGDLDMASVRSLDVEQQDLVEHDGRPSVVVDCTGLVFLDSSAVRVLLKAQQRPVQQGRELRLVNVPEAPRLRLEMYGLGQVLRMG